jgi:hypothetical protein
LQNCEFDVVYLDPFYSPINSFVQVENIFDELIVRNGLILELLSKKICYDLRSIDLAECVVQSESFLEILFGKRKICFFFLFKIV